MERASLEDIVAFLMGNLKYFGLYFGIFLTALFSFCFSLSGILALKDKFDYPKRYEKLYSYHLLLDKLSSFIDDYSWIQKEMQSHRNLMTQYAHLKNIAIHEAKKYFRFAAFSFCGLLLFFSLWFHVYQIDIESHLPTRTLNENIFVEETTVEKNKIYEVLDKSTFTKYTYVLNKEDNRIKYVSQSFIIPEMLQNIFLVFYILFMVGLRYLIKIFG